ncbi:MAG: hypothetical protein IJW19_05940 [Clostridia bacterium]|nr:hypothetical protein [Clostridia bacterium]
MNYYDDPFISKLQSSAPFPIDYEIDDGYPDVIFDIIFENPPDEEAKARCVRALAEYMYKYNRIHFIRPIHYVSGIEDLPSPSSVYSLCIHMDFGGASPRALIGAVKAIADTGLKIYRLVLE